MKINKAKLALVFVLVALVFSALTWFYWDFVRDTIALPLYYLIWIGDLILKSISQGAYLAFLVLLGIIISIHTLLGIQAGPITRGFEPNPPYTTRYQFWSNLCANLYSSRFSREMFATEARKLLLSILAYQEGVDISEVEARIRDGTLPAPDPIKYLIQHKEIKAPQQTASITHSALLRLRRLFHTGESQHDPQIDSQIAEIVGFIEGHLEINHAGNQPESQS